MSNPPRIWLDYRPVRIGWVIPDRDIALFATAVSWSTCLWGGRYNCMIPAYDAALADRLLSCFGADVLLPVHADAATTAFIARHLHLQHERWRDSIAPLRVRRYSPCLAPDRGPSGQGGTGAVAVARVAGE
jgi:hypothetical protein